MGFLFCKAANNSCKEASTDDKVNQFKGLIREGWWESFGHVMEGREPRLLLSEQTLTHVLSFHIENTRTLMLDVY